MRQELDFWRSRLLSYALLTFVAGICLALLVDRPAPVHAQLAASTGFHYTDISSSASTVVKGAQGTLHTIVVNNAGSGGWTYQIFDNTACSGTAVACSTACTLPTAGTTMHFDIQAATGICVKTATGTAGDLTVTWR